jgi:hypothetical protein
MYVCVRVRERACPLISAAQLKFAIEALALKVSKRLYSSGGQQDIVYLLNKTADLPTGAYSPKHRDTPSSHSLSLPPPT